jgi:hypothetical protein
MAEYGENSVQYRGFALDSKNIDGNTRRNRPSFITSEAEKGRQDDAFASFANRDSNHFHSFHPFSVSNSER